jgi:hypothetical protein
VRVEGAHGVLVVGGDEDDGGAGIDQLEHFEAIELSRLLKKSAASLRVETKARLYVSDSHARNRYPAEFNVQLPVAGRARTGEAPAAADSSDG